MADWRDQGKQRVKEKGEGNTLKLIEGENCIRVLPDKKDLLPNGKLNPKGVQNSPIREFRQHENVGPDKRQVACGKDIKGEGDCWLCDKQIPALEQKNKLQQVALLQPKEKFVVQASKLDPDTSKFTMPKPFWVSTGAGTPGKSSNSLAVRVYSKIVSSKKDFVDPVKGYNLNITKTGQGIKTRYPEIESDESPTKVPLSVLAQVKDLDKIIPQYDEEEQKSVYFGRPKKDEDGEEDKPRRRTKVKEPEEDTDEDEVEEDEEISDEDVEEDEEMAVEEEEDDVVEDDETEEEDTEEETSEDEDEDEDETSDEEDEEEVAEEEEEEEEEEKPAPPKKAVAKKAVAKKAASPATKKAAAKKKR